MTWSLTPLKGRGICKKKVFVVALSPENLFCKPFFSWVMSFSLTESLVYIELNKCYLLTKSGYNHLFVSDHWN